MHARSRHTELRRNAHHERVGVPHIRLRLQTRRLVDEKKTAIFSEDGELTRDNWRPPSAQRSSEANADPVVRCTSSTRTGSVASCSRNDCFTNSSWSGLILPARCRVASLTRPSKY